MRKKFKHVIAVQATITYTEGDVPYYDLAQLGGEDKMRGYYGGENSRQGAGRRTTRIPHAVLEYIRYRRLGGYGKKSGNRV